jgi:hypothetical protein
MSKITVLDKNLQYIRPSSLTTLKKINCQGNEEELYIQNVRKGKQMANKILKMYECMYI